MSNNQATLGTLKGQLKCKKHPSILIDKIIMNNYIIKYISFVNFKQYFLLITFVIC